MNTTFTQKPVEQTQTAFAPIAACRIPTAPTLIASLIKEGNKKFKRMTRAQKRVEIAKDALMQIRAGKTIVVSGSYLYQEEGGEYAVGIKTVQTCHACAKGALFLAKTRRAGTPTLGYEAFNGEQEAMPEWPEANWHLIEVAFEGAVMDSPLNCPKNWGDSVTKAKEFYYAHPGDNRRLIAILKNIIKNNGTFVP